MNLLASARIGFGWLEQDCNHHQVERERAWCPRVAAIATSTSHFAAPVGTMRL
ncbi:hypothetical protein KR51_00020340 [Rubidibacter lacunae KORDI 51-2]|uniref:Uncharacterized protein n=1 Tax=Rubidibacter lacunae KORDI 51-2 TaxID=582515 RepID=U5DLK2_9CHRO|nr:hypothetical protein KR51_00020340 [Rubidibacter lacunae KORDI 51-2]